MLPDSLELIALNTIPFQSVLDYLNRGFENYLVPLSFTQPLLTSLIRADAIDFNTSQVVQVGGEPAGIVLIATRGWKTRLAAFGIFSEWRGKGVGAWFTQQLVEQARQRNERQMVLEVLTENHAAIHLYRQAGFQETRRLVGFAGTQMVGEVCAEVEECDPNLAARLLLATNCDLPWQVSAETLLQAGSYLRALRLGQSLVFCHSFGENDALIRGLYFSNPEEAQRLLRHAFTLYPERTWRMAPHFPEAMVLPLMTDLGMIMRPEAQFEMRLALQEPR